MLRQRQRRENRHGTGLAAFKRLRVLRQGPPAPQEKNGGRGAGEAGRRRLHQKPGPRRLRAAPQRQRERRGIPHGPDRREIRLGQRRAAGGLQRGDQRAAGFPPRGSGTGNLRRQGCQDRPHYPRCHEAGGPAGQETEDRPGKPGRAPEGAEPRSPVPAPGTVAAL